MSALKLAAADKRAIFTRQRLLRWVLLALLEREHGREGCPDLECSLCRKRRARVTTLERRLSVVLLCTESPAQVRIGRGWAERLIASSGLRRRRFKPAARLAAVRYLTDRGYLLQESESSCYAWKDPRR